MKDTIDPRTFYSAIAVGMTPYQKKTGLARGLKQVLQKLQDKIKQGSDYEPCYEEHLLDSLGEYFEKECKHEKTRNGLVNCLSLLSEAPIGAEHSVILFAKKYNIYELSRLIEETAIASNQFISSIALNALPYLTSARAA